MTLSGMENNLRPLNMLLQAVAILNNRRQARTVFGREDDADGLSHAHIIACFAKFVNPMFASVYWQVTSSAASSELSSPSNNGRCLPARRRAIDTAEDLFGGRKFWAPA